MTMELVVECDVAQGLAFRQDRRETVGYLTTLTIGDTVVAPDLKVTLPPPEAALPVVGVLARATWSTLPDGTITLACRISSRCAARLRDVTAGKAMVGFVVFGYDATHRVYYHAFESYAGYSVVGVRTPGVVHALVSGVELEPAADGLAGLRLTVAPPVGPLAQQIMIHTSSTAKLVQPWGVVPRDNA